MYLCRDALGLSTGLWPLTCPETGDVIISLNGSEIEELIDLCDAPFNLPVGVPAKFVILRGLEEVTIKVTPSFLQASATP